MCLLVTNYIYKHFGLDYHLENLKIKIAPYFKSKEQLEKEQKEELEKELKRKEKIKKEEERQKKH